MMAVDNSPPKSERATGGDREQTSSTVVPPTNLSGQDVHFDEVTEKSLVRKLDRRLVLLAFLCCMTPILF